MQKYLGTAVLIFWASFALGEKTLPAGPTTNLLEVRSVTVDGNTMSQRNGRELKLGPFPGRVTINFGPPTNSDWAPMRLSYKLEGYDAAWRKGQSDVMNFSIS